MEAQPATPLSARGQKPGEMESPADVYGLLRRWLSISESQICALEVLAAHLPEVNDLLDGSFSEISQNFVEVSGQLDCYRKKVEIMAARDQSAEGEEALAMAHDISQRVGKLIVSLQFQDRVSQNMVITVNVMRAIVEYLQAEIKVTAGSLLQAETGSVLDVEFAEKLIALLNLGELKQRFVEHLLAHGYITDAAEVGYNSGEYADCTDDDIDLF